MAGRNKEFYLRRIVQLRAEFAECYNVPRGKRTTSYWRASNTTVSRKMANLRKLWRVNAMVLRAEWGIDSGAMPQG